MPVFALVFASPQVRRAVRGAIENSVEDNILIFYSGHGTMMTPSAEAKEALDKGPEKDLPLKEVHQALALPLRTFPFVEYFDYYYDSDLTHDVRVGILGRHKATTNVYLVLHSCNSGGMFHGWELDTRDRTEGGLSIALFASAAGENTADWLSTNMERGYVHLFTQYAIPGRFLKDIEADIFYRSLEENPDRDPGLSPMLVTVRPEQADEPYLP